jgi:hypothetical protein
LESANDDDNDDPTTGSLTKEYEYHVAVIQFVSVSVSATKQVFRYLEQRTTPTVSPKYVFASKGNPQGVCSGEISAVPPLSIEPVL